jgi:hypothetical protein
MAHAPATLNMAANPHVIGRVSEHHCRRFVLRETPVIQKLARVAAQNTMFAQNPEIAEAGNSWACGRR